MSINLSHGATVLAAAEVELGCVLPDGGQLEDSEMEADDGVANINNNQDEGQKIADDTLNNITKTLKLTI